MLASGTEWQAKALAEAADTIKAKPELGPVENAERTAYARGVADVLRAVAGHLDTGTVPALDEIFEIYSDSI